VQDRSIRISAIRGHAGAYKSAWDLENRRKRSESDGIQRSATVFECKWASLPQFQRTRNVLRMLAVWVHPAHQGGFRGAHKDPLISLGTAPIDDLQFREAVLEQLGEDRLRVPVTADIAGTSGAHALRLDNEAPETLRKARLHQKVATTAFFESNGGMARGEAGNATLGEIRLALGEPDLDLGNVETALEALRCECYYLTAEGSRYRFSLRANLNKVLADRLGSVADENVDEAIGKQVHSLFPSGHGAERFVFPEDSSVVPDRPVLTIAVLAFDRSREDGDRTDRHIEALIKNHGNTGRTCKSALLFAVPERPGAAREAARRTLAWEIIRDDASSGLQLGDADQSQLAEGIRKAACDLKEAAWRTYMWVVFLDTGGSLRWIDLGLTHAGSERSLIALILRRLEQDDEVLSQLSPSFLLRNWPSTPEWTTRAVRDAFFASPRFPRILSSEVIKQAIARGVSENLMAYAGPLANGQYQPFCFESSMTPLDVEIGSVTVIMTADEARRHQEPPQLTRIEVLPRITRLECGAETQVDARAFDQHGQPMANVQIAQAVDQGEISQDGRFTAPSTAVLATITASSGDVSARQRSRSTSGLTTASAPHPKPAHCSCAVGSASQVDELLS